MLKFLIIEFYSQINSF